MRSILLSLLLIAGPASIAGCRAPASDISPSADEARPPDEPSPSEPAENYYYAELAKHVPIVCGRRFDLPLPTLEQVEELLRWVLPRAGKNRDVWFIHARANWKFEEGRKLSAAVYFTPERESARLRKGVFASLDLAGVQVFAIKAIRERLGLEPQPIKSPPLREYWQVSLKDHPFAETFEVPDGTLLPFPKPEGFSELEVIKIVDFVRTNPKQSQTDPNRVSSASLWGLDGPLPILSINKRDGVIDVYTGTREGSLSGSGQFIWLKQTDNDTFDVLATGFWVS